MRSWGITSRDPDDHEGTVVAQVLPEHKKMLKALSQKLECSRAEVIRTLIEDAYAELVPDGPLKPTTRRFVATDGRVYFKSRGIK